MKRILVLLPIALFVAAVFSRPGVVKGQTDQPSRLVEPETAEVFYKLDDGKLIPLERQTAPIQGRVSGLVVISIKSVSEFGGGKATFRFRSDGPLEFVVRSALASS